MKRDLRFTRSLGRRAGALGLVGCAAAGCGVGRTETLVTALVVGVPAQAAALQPAVSLNGVVARDLLPLSLRGAAGSVEVSFRVDLLAENSRGALGVGVRALDGAGCALSVGSGAVAVDSMDTSLLLMLGAVGADCAAGSPRLYAVTPTEVGVESPGVYLTLRGWGLDPLARVTLNGTEAGPVQAHSPTEIVVSAPSLQGTSGQPVTVTVSNPSGGADSRGDLLVLE